MERSKSIESIFDECLESVLSGRETVEQCLQRYPEHATELDSLLSTAMSVNRAVQVRVDPQTIARGRYKLQLKMAEMSKPRRPFFRLQPRWALPVLVPLLVFVLGAGTVLAADSSLPGSPLYPVKIATENARMGLARTDTEKAALATVFADRRITETYYMLKSGHYSAADMDKAAERYITNVEQVSAASQHAVGVAAVVAASAPPETTMPGTAQATDKAQATGKDDRDLEDLKETISAYGDTHTMQLAQWIDSENVKDKDKPALRRMLDEAKKKYPEAVHNLESQGQGNSNAGGKGKK
jgi:hypothetical protein